MKTLQFSKLAMYRVVHTQLIRATETGEIVALPAKIGAFTRRLEEIAMLAATQAQPLRIATAERDAQLGDAIHLARTVAGIVLSYAKEKKRESLAAQVRIKPRDLKNLRYAQRVELARHVHATAVSVLPELADHGVTEELLHELHAKIEAAAIAVGLPRQTEVRKKAATEQLVVMFREMDEFLKDQLDPLLFPLQLTQPEFYARYRAARMVIARPGTHRMSSSEDAAVATPSSPFETTAPRLEIIAA